MTLPRKTVRRADETGPKPIDSWSKPQPVKELLRPALFRARTLGLALLARLSFRADYEIVHVLGCGRSGTTIIGNVIGLDEDILYLNEPYYYWFNVSSQTDFGNLLGTDGVCWLAPADITAPQLKRSRRMLSAIARLKHKRYIVEKTPINSLRVDWLHTLQPRARFVVIHRDWVDIVNSIVDLTENKRYRLAGRPGFHHWWGENHHKVHALLDHDPHCLATPALRGFVKGRIAARDFPAINLNMAVFEALASQVAIAHARKHSGVPEDAFFDINYDRFIAAPHDEVGPALRWIKRGVEPKTPQGAFSVVNRRIKKTRLSEDAILAMIHPDLCAQVETHLKR